MVIQFDTRLDMGVQFEEEVQWYLSHRDKIIKSFRIGLEHTLMELMCAIKNRTDAVSMFLRFTPDGVAIPVDDDAFFWEAKAGVTIERNAYENYMKLSEIGCDVLLFIHTGDHVMTCRVSSMTFISSDIVVGRYASDKRFPIVDGWITPELADNTDDLRVGSKKAYREIDLSSCRQLMTAEEWKIECQTMEEKQ